MKKVESNTTTIQPDDDTESPAKKLLSKPAASGTSRILKGGKLHMPDPVIQKSHRVIGGDIPPALDELPADLKSALVLQKSINVLPDRTPGKAQRLQRVSRHVESLCGGRNPHPPQFTVTDLRNHFMGAPPTPQAIEAARNSLK